MSNKQRSPWFWVPSLYYAEGIPYVIVMMVSVVMYKRLGISNADIALYTSWLYLPWVIKPLWSPLVDILRTKRFWIVTMQLIIGAGLAGIALTIPLPNFFKYTLAFFWLLAFSSATHDIAADGFYMLGLDDHNQAWFVGIRATFYRFAMITGQGLLIILAGFIESHSGLPTVDITAESRPTMEQQRFVHPDSVRFPEVAGETRIITVPEKITIPARPRSKKEVDSLLAFVKEWNIQHGFARDEAAEQQQAAAANGEEPSWWHETVVQPLEEYLRRHFGKETAVAGGDYTGNIGIVYFRLSSAPGDEAPVVINFGRSSGDKSIFMQEEPALGSRLEFDNHNWNIPALAVIHLDPKLRIESEATFSAQAGNIPLAWSITFFVLAALFIAFFLYHKFILPYPPADKAAPVQSAGDFFKEFVNTFALFFKKKRIWAILLFLLLFRLAESQLSKLAPPFLLDKQEMGGLALTTGEVGFIYGTIGLLFLSLGGILGGFLAARHGLKFWLWPMAIAINLPDVVYVYLSYTLPDNLFIINVCVAIEQFGYGFGFTAYMLYMIYASEGEHKTAHFAITTGFMALGMMIPGMFSGWLQEIIGYQHFFIEVMIATIPSFLVLFFIPLDKDFGKKKSG